MKSLKITIFATFLPLIGLCLHAQAQLLLIQGVTPLNLVCHITINGTVKTEEVSITYMGVQLKSVSGRLESMVSPVLGMDQISISLQASPRLAFAAKGSISNSKTVSATSSFNGDDINITCASK